jgi:hypothetical protein
VSIYRRPLQRSHWALDGALKPLLIMASGCWSLATGQQPRGQNANIKSQLPPA